MPFLGCVYDDINVSTAPVQAGLTVGSVLFWPVPFLGFISGRSLLHVSEVASHKSVSLQTMSHTHWSKFILGFNRPVKRTGSVQDETH